MEGTKRFVPWMLAVAAAVASASPAMAGGFNIYEAGARATALGCAFTATADDGSAIFYNPAGIAFQPGTRLDANLMPIVPGTEFAGAVPPAPPAVGKTVDQSFPIPGLYFTHSRGDLAYGLGIYAPFGLGVEWEDPETWVGRQSSYDVDLATIYVTPTIAWRLSERSALAMGVDIASCKIELNRFGAIPFGGLSEPLNVIDSQLEGRSKLNLTPVFGLLGKPRDDVSLGFMFHAPKNLEFRDRDATLTNIAPAALAPTIDQQIAAWGGSGQKVDANLHLPWIMSLGVAYQLHERARLEFNAVHFGWSHFKALKLDFASETMPDQVIEEEYEDIWQLRFGLDVDVSPSLKAMFGYVHDNSPQPYESMSPMLPDADREDFSAGLQWRRNRWKFTGSYMAVLFHERSNVVDGVGRRFAETQPLGSYDSIAHIFGAGLGYQF